MAKKAKATTEAKKKKERRTLALYENIRLEPNDHEGANRVVVTGPGTDITVRKGMEDAIDWSFSEKGKYTIRHMDEYGVEYNSEEIEVK